MSIADNKSAVSVTDGKSAGHTSEGRASALLGLAFCVAGFFGLAPAAIVYGGWQPAHAWLMTVAAGVAVMFALGKATKQHVLLDERLRWSLSRLQLLSWTLLLLPTIWAMVIVRLTAGDGDALALGVDENLWALLGISAASFVGSPMVLERKRETPGTLDTRSDAKLAGISDLVRGEDTGNAAVIDVSRVQMCFFTFVALAVYAVAVWHAFTTRTAAALAFPAMSQNLVVLLGISHATYLAAKLPNHSTT